MEHLSEKSQLMSAEDIRSNPGLVADLLLKDGDISVIFEKRGDKVAYAYLKTYDSETIRILREAKAEHKRLREKGYARDQAFADFEQAWEKCYEFSGFKPNYD